MVPEDSTIYLHAALATAVVATFLLPTAAAVAFALCIAVCILVPVNLKTTYITAVLLRCPCLPNLRTDPILSVILADCFVHCLSPGAVGLHLS